MANLDSAIKNATVGISLLPSVLQGVKMVEDENDQLKASTGLSMNGAVKKQLVTDTILGSIEVAAHAGEQIPNVYVQTISALIDAVVSIFNASGIFKKKAPAPPAEPEPLTLAVEHTT